MINFWIGIPLPVRMAMLTVLGIAGGALANYVIYTWCYFPRAINPWATAHADAPQRKSSDRIPILGWIGLRREASIHGRGFWIRPILVELGLAIGLPALFWYETQIGGVLPNGINAANIPIFEPWGTQMFFGHAFLVVLMVAATFIDFDEQTIPDVITVPGTIIALLMTACSMKWFLPIELTTPAGVSTLFPVTYDHPWGPPNVPKWWSSTGLLTGLAIWSGWCFALADRRVIMRRGLAKAIEYFFAAMVRYTPWKLLLGIWLVGAIAITVVHKMGGEYWYGLFSSLVGLAIGGGVIWAIRIVASTAAGKEAMGFGDVTLMAMVGALLGWQGAVVAFFLAPFTSIVIVIVQYVITRNSQVPFGPYLCAGTLLTILFWPDVYGDWLAINIGMLGPVILPGAIAMLGLLGGMMLVMRIAKSVFR